MYTTFVLSRALYEFFYTRGRYCDDARAAQLTPKWKIDGQSDRP